MKRCSMCGENKPEDQFYWRIKAKGIRSPNCIPCRKAQRKASWQSGAERERNYANKKKHYDMLRDFLWTVLESASCVDCGFNNPIALEFDHVRGKKVADVFRMVGSNYGLDSIKAEIAKCEIVCANCHKIRTSTRGNHWRVQRLTAAR